MVGAQYSFRVPADPEVAWKMGLIPVMAQLEELNAAGENGDVMAKARAAFEKETAPLVISTGEKEIPPGTFRLVVAKPC